MAEVALFNAEPAETVACGWQGWLCRLLVTIV